MSRRLADLATEFRPLAEKLLARCADAGVFLVVVDTLRTPEEHARNLAAGVSWTTRSKHLDGLAIDVCPVRLLSEKGWAPWHPDWQKIGEIGEALGLRWGGRWKQRDMGHFEAQGWGGPTASLTASNRSSQSGQ